MSLTGPEHLRRGFRRPSLSGVQAVILCGLQGSGKTTLYRDRFLETHARVSMDLLRTRAREAGFGVGSTA